MWQRVLHTVAIIAFILSQSIQPGISDAFKTQWNNGNRISVVSCQITKQDIQCLILTPVTFWQKKYKCTPADDVHCQKSCVLDLESAKTTLERDLLPQSKNHDRINCCYSDLFRALLISQSLTNRLIVAEFSFSCICMQNSFRISNEMTILTS
jgi:hypothetical protein